MDCVWGVGLMQWGDPFRVSADFNAHLNTRHMFDYAEFCDFDGSEEALVAQALRESKEEAAREEAMHRAQRTATPPREINLPEDEDEMLRLAIERSMREY